MSGSGYTDRVLHQFCCLITGSLFKEEFNTKLWTWFLNHEWFFCRSTSLEAWLFIHLSVRSDHHCRMHMLCLESGWRWQNKLLVMLGLNFGMNCQTYWGRPFHIQDLKNLWKQIILVDVMTLHHDIMASWKHKNNKTRILQAKQYISTDIWIWPFKVTKAQTDFAIQTGTNDSL